MHLRPPEDLQRIGEVRRRVQTWQKGANLAEGCKPGRRVQTWQKGANLAEGCKPGRRVQTWQKGANLAAGCKRCKKWVSPLHLCTFCRRRPLLFSASLGFATISGEHPTWPPPKRTAMTACSRFAATGRHGTSTRSSTPWNAASR